MCESVCGREPLSSSLVVGVGRGGPSLRPAATGKMNCLFQGALLTFVLVRVGTSRRIEKRVVYV